MQTIDHAFLTLCSELNQRCLEQAFVSEFSTAGGSSRR